MADAPDDDAGLLGPLVGDGRPALFALAAALLFAGGLALFLSATGELLPQDTHHLGMTASQLCEVADCRINDFMVHDRASFGGTLLGLGILYTWLTAFALGRGEQWAWWTWLVSGVLGFATFFAYLGYGYLDRWHLVATLLMLPLFVVGMVRTRHLVDGPLSPRSLLRDGGWLARRDRFALGRILLISGAAAVAVSGAIILRIGVGDTFVPEDLEFIGLTAEEIRAINPRLVPLLAHDRAGFGGGTVTMGLTTMLCLWCGRPSRHLHQAVALAGLASLSSTLVVHAAVGYTDVFHLAPPVAGAACLVVGLALTRPGATEPGRSARLQRRGRDNVRDRKHGRPSNVSSASRQGQLQNPRAGADI